MLDHADQAHAQAPLAGVILCCTSIGPEQRNELAKWATDMGAAHKFDLTSDVTHLVAGQLDTQKYKYVAKERPDVKVVTTKWVAAVRESWLQGGETDVEKLEMEHRVPTFFGLRICVTGFEDLSQRKYLEDTVTAHGAAYQGDLTKAVTHLIASAPKGKKYEHARLWGLKIVTIEWLSDSLERGMALEESLYDPLLPKEDRGKDAFKKIPQKVSMLLGKRMRSATVDEGEGKRKLRRTASTKLGSQSSAIWNDITTGSFGAKQEEVDSWQDLKSDGLVSSEVVPAMGRASLNKSANVPQLTSSSQRKTRPAGTTGCFDNRVIYVYGFDRVKTEILQEHLQRNGARLAITPEQLCSHGDTEVEDGFLITPSDVPRDSLEDLPLVAEGLTRVNEWWVEKCIYRKTIVDPAGEVICKPFPRVPIDEFRDLVITSTGFTDYDRLHVSKVVRLMGATYDEYLKESVSVLICSSDAPKNPKVKFCQDRSIPVVSPSWLWNCVSTGTRRGFDTYLLKLSAERSREPSQQAQACKDSERSAEATKNERAPLHESGGHNNLALSKVPSPDGSKPDQQESLERPESNKMAARRQTARPARHSVPFYESASEGEDAGGPGGDSAAPDDDPAPIANLDGTASQKHLQELSPSEANAPRNPLPANDARIERKEPLHYAQEEIARPKSNPITPPTSSDVPLKASTASAPPVAPTVPPTTDSTALNTTIAALLAQKKQQHSSRPGSAGSTGAPDNGASVSRSRQRRRPLGRAPSITSATSSLSASNPHNPTASADPGTAVQHNNDVETAPDGFLPPEPSQVLVWGDGEGEAERVDMIRRVGGTVLEQGGGAMKAVERIGRARDVGDDMLGEGTGVGGVGSRVGRRRAVERGL